MAKKKKSSPKDLTELEKLILSELGEEGFHRAADTKVLKPIPTGLLSLDQVIGGGLPRARLTEIFGPPSSGKTLLLLNAIAQAQKEGGVAVFIDLEKSFDPEWAETNGVDIDELRILRPSSGEEAYEYIIKYLETHEVDIIGVDSVAQLVPSAELEGGIADANIGLAARLNAKAMRKITSILGDTCVVLINQTRANVSTGPFGGKPTTTAGGRAIPFYASLRLDLRRIGWNRSGEEKIGAVYRARVEKCKVKGARLHANATYEVDFLRGLDIPKDIMVHAAKRDLLEKKGAWFYVDGKEKPIQGEDATKEWLLENGYIEKWRKQIEEEDESSEEDGD